MFSCGNGVATTIAVVAIRLVIFVDWGWVGGGIVAKAFGISDYTKCRCSSRWVSAMHNII